MQSNLNNIPTLQGLRGVAALAVFFVHYNQTVRFQTEVGPVSISRIMEQGELGVALFFVLSGFLLSLPFWLAQSGGGKFPSIREFFIRRCARIIPAYYVALTLLILVTGLWRFDAAHADIWLHYLLLFNYAEFSIFSINAPFWTLAVEAQFYLLLPLLFLPLKNRTMGISLLTVAVCAVTSYAAHYVLIKSFTSVIPWPGSPYLTWIRPYGAVLNQSLLAHLPHFLIGVLTAPLFLKLNAAAKANKINRNLVAYAFWGSLVSLMLLVSFDLIEVIDLPFGRYGLPLIPVLIAGVISCAPFCKTAVVLLDSKPARMMGKISYGFYIYHAVVLIYLDRALQQRSYDAAEHWIIYGLIGLSLSLIAAFASYRLVERPVLRWVHNRHQNV